MSRIIDLTATLGDPRIPVVPSFPEVKLEAFHVHKIHGRSNMKLSMPIHVGTHIDAPYHFVPDGIAIDELPLGRLMGRAVRLDVRKISKEKTPVAVAQVKDAVKINKITLKDKIAVIHSGWAEKAFYQPTFYKDNPYLAPETSQWLVDQGIKAIALDHPIDESVKPGVTAHPGDSPNHRCFLKNGVPLIENLINLETFNDIEFEMIALPLKVYRCDGGPARVIVILKD